MPDYKRVWVSEGTYFFTVNLPHRQGNDLLVRHSEALCTVLAEVKRNHPFDIHAGVVLPDHLHCVIGLPEGAADYALRGRLIKSGFSNALPAGEHCRVSRTKRGERGIWQRRYWAHMIRDEADFRAHLDYIHINPLKHGLVKSVADWPYSTFHEYLMRGIYPENWAGGCEVNAAAIPD
jgi:putative transposase